MVFESTVIALTLATARELLTIKVQVPRLALQSRLPVASASGGDDDREDQKTRSEALRHDSPLPGKGARVKVALARFVHVERASLGRPDRGCPTPPSHKVILM